MQNRHQQEQEKWEERYRCEREETEDCREQSLERQMHQHMEMMQMMMISVMHTKKAVAEEQKDIDANGQK